MWIPLKEGIGGERDGDFTYNFSTLGNFSECLNPCFQPECLHFLCTTVACGVVCIPQLHDLLLRVQVWTWALLPRYPMLYLSCFVSLCLIASATTLHYTTIIPWWWKCVWFHNVEFAIFFMLVCLQRAIEVHSLEF